MLLLNGIQDRYFIEISNFNTSYVVIKPFSILVIFASKFISIHLMLLLNLDETDRILIETYHFNTSYVVIKLIWD